MPVINRIGLDPSRACFISTVVEGKGSRTHTVQRDLRHGITVLPRFTVAPLRLHRGALYCQALNSSELADPKVVVWDAVQGRGRSHSGAMATDDDKEMRSNGGFGAHGSTLFTLRKLNAFVSSRNAAGGRLFLLVMQYF
jgi:hypothetical protein